MGQPPEDKCALKASGASAPEYARIAAVCRIFGLSRSGVYKLAAKGKIEMVKSGSTSLVNCATVRAHMASLPRADIRVGQSRDAEFAQNIAA